MNPNFKSIRLSIVDLMACFLPGVVWFDILVTLNRLIASDQSAPIVTPINAFHDIVSFLTPSTTYTALLYLIAFAIVAFLIGYILNQVTTSVAEKICFLDALWKSRRNKVSKREYHFPYNAIFKAKPYFDRVTSSINEYLKENPFTLPGKQPFSTCKRILRVNCPELWEESERAEADTRMIGSLFSAAVFSILCVILALMKYKVLFYPLVVWLSISFILVAVLGNAFRKQRMREVSYAYLNYLIALREVGKKVPGKAKKNSGKKNSNHRKNRTFESKG